ncbi:MAG: FtsX-like permease family protein [Thermoguttaceae bacterium]|jgi:putative ABC transport system permease protein
MRFSTFVFKNVLRRRTRSTLTATGIAVAVAAAVALVGLADGFKTSLLDNYVKGNVTLIVSRCDTVNLLTGTMPEKTADEIAQLPEVKDVGAGLVDFTALEDLGNEMIGVQGWPAGAYTFDDLKILKGESLSEKDHGKHNIIVGCKLADIKKVAVGSTLSMSDEKLHVVGVFQGASPTVDGMIILLLEDAQHVLGKTGVITGCTVRLKDPSDENIKSARAAIEGPVAAKFGLKGKISAMAPEQFVDNNNQARFIKAMAWAVTVIALIICGIGVLNTMVMSVFERTREIGILRAIGWQPSRVMRMILMESVLLSLVGGVLGTLMGLGMILALSRVPLMNGAVHAAITPRIIGQGFAIAILVGLIGAAYPAFRGARLLPTEAIRHE